jgi:hypothetical protein
MFAYLFDFRTKKLTMDDMKNILNTRTASGASAELSKSLMVSSDKSTKPVFPHFRLLNNAKRQALAGKWPLLGDGVVEKWGDLPPALRSQKEKSQKGRKQQPRKARRVVAPSVW